MVVSMTGFGRSKLETDQFIVTVEIKSVNHRFREFYFRMPRQLLKIEDKIKKTISNFVSRGRIEVYVTVDGVGLLDRKVQVDWDLLDEYKLSLDQIVKKYNLSEQMALQHIVNREEFLQIVEKDEENESLNETILLAAKKAAIDLKRMRETEGAALQTAIKSFVDELKINYDILLKRSPVVVTEYEERLTNKLAELVDDEVDEARVLTEVLIFTEKADISEELTRLNSHLLQLIATLQLNEPIGRKIDFILQELNREVNTIGAKANDTLISNTVVEMKSLLEKIKEQVQNIE